MPSRMDLYHNHNNKKPKNKITDKFAKIYNSFFIDNGEQIKHIQSKPVIHKQHARHMASSNHISYKNKKTIKSALYGLLAICVVFGIYAAAFGHSNKSNNVAEESSSSSEVNSMTYSHKKHKKHHTNTEASSTNNDNDVNNDTTENTYRTNSNNTHTHYNQSTAASHKKNSRTYYDSKNDNSSSASSSQAQSESSSSINSFNDVNSALEYGRSHLNGNNTNFNVTNNNDGTYSVNFY